MNCVLGRLYQRCDAKVCKCPKGREHHLNGSKFEIVRCEVRRMKMFTLDYITLYGYCSVELAKL